MKIGDKVKTPNGRGEVIPMIGKPSKDKEYLVRLNKKIGIYDQFLYSKKELTLYK